MFQEVQLNASNLDFELNTYSKSPVPTDMLIKFPRLKWRVIESFFAMSNIAWSWASFVKIFGCKFVSSNYYQTTGM